MATQPPPNVALNGHAIKVVRTLLGQSQYELARDLGIERSALTRIEAGTRGTSPSPRLVAAITHWATTHGWDRRAFLMYIASREEDAA